VVKKTKSPDRAANPLLRHFRQRASTRVLIVDDMFAMRKLIAAVVREMGIEHIAEANNGQNALDHLARFPVDLLICDWNMPGMTGLDVLMAVRADPRLQNLPVLMVTAEQSAQQVVDAIQAGVTSYVAKPFLPPTLKLHIHKCLMRGESSSKS
jgi:two-component system, chemotaxis family, chemotaxis protein CheY